MKLTMTIMVRDEADVIGAMLRHHADQGIDEFIVTDNGSIDGTSEIIEELSATLPITLLRDPEHRKQQGETGQAQELETGEEEQRQEKRQQPSGQR